ncbi:MAG: hypothetical protein F6K09_37165, partial [Merismopedia sp. SIO2A8]|nr:hypothetical protein [Merismopedia sp. SIO2A8]
MSPRKLSDADKSEILELYRQQSETTSTLATRYGVSNSTISRILKSSLVESEYEALIQQKRLGRTSSSSTHSIENAPPPTDAEAESSLPIPIAQPAVESEESESELASNSNDGRRRRRRSSVPSKPVYEEHAIQTELQLDITAEPQEDEAFDEIEFSATTNLEGLLDEDLIDLDEDDEDLDDLDEDDDDDWEEEELDSPTRQKISASFPKTGVSIEVIPLSEASLPKVCYLVVDRSAELIARPLKEFSDLGQIPDQEFYEKTLPIFDNHRVARRFSNRSQRVIKVPDGQMLQKTAEHLQANSRLILEE